MSSIGIVAQTLSATAEEEQHVFVFSTEPNSFGELCLLKPKVLISTKTERYCLCLSKERALVKRRVVAQCTEVLSQIFIR